MTRVSTVSRRDFLKTTSLTAGATLLAGAPAALGQQGRELNVWHTEVEPQTVKTIQETSIAEFERKFPGFKVKQQALGWGDLNTKLLAALAAGSPPDLTHLNPFMTASLYVKHLLRPMDELIRALGESDIHEATLKLQHFDGKYYGVTHAMGATYFCERRDLREKKGLKPPETFDDMLKLCAALTEDGRYAIQVPGEKLYMGFGVAGLQRGHLGRRQDVAATTERQVDARNPRLPAEAQPVPARGLVGTEVSRHAGRAGHRQDRDVASLGGARHRLHREVCAREHARPRALHADAAPARTVREDRHDDARRRELGRVLAVEVPERGVRILEVVLQEGALPGLLPLGADPSDTDLQVHAQRPRVPRAPTHQEVEVLHDAMLAALRDKRLLPLGFTRPDDNLLPFLAELDGSSIVADMVVEVMVGQKPPKAEADRAQKRAEELLTQLGHKRWS